VIFVDQYVQEKTFAQVLLSLAKLSGMRVKHAIEDE
jgi:hypothetical protein